MITGMLIVSVSKDFTPLHQCLKGSKGFDGQLKKLTWKIG